MERSGAETIKSISLSKLIPYVEAIETEVGKALMSFLVEEYYRTLVKAASVNSTVEDRVRHAVVSDMVKFWAGKVIEYEKSLRRTQ